MVIISYPILNVNTDFWIYLFNFLIISRLFAPALFSFGIPINPPITDGINEHISPTGIDKILPPAISEIAVMIVNRIVPQIIADKIGREDLPLAQMIPPSIEANTVISFGTKAINTLGSSVFVRKIALSGISTPIVAAAIPTPLIEQVSAEALTVLTINSPPEIKNSLIRILFIKEYSHKGTFIH